MRLSRTGEGLVIGFVGAFALRFGVGILPAMPGRGHRLHAARVISACVGVAVLGVSAAGCDSHSKPRAVDDPSSSRPLVTAGPSSAGVSPSAVDAPSPSSSPLEGESALNSAFPSAAARIPDAIATVRRFFDGINHESDTGDEGPAIATFTTKCNLCGSEVYSIRSLLDGGHKLRGGHTHLVSIDQAFASYGNVVSVVVTSTEDASDQLDATGNIVRQFDAAPPTKFDFELEINDSPPKIWQLTRVEQ